MMDSNRRIIDYMRVSITDRCNLRCRYCMPENVPFVPHESILRYEEILRVCRVAAGLGIRNLKVTGGEPLVRKGCTELMKEMKAIPGIEHVTLTTNAVLLEKHLPALCELGVDSINISLDTLDPDLYRRITGHNQLNRVIAGFLKAIKNGLRVKINCVAMAETGIDGLIALAALAERYPVDVRFIEMMPIGRGRDYIPLDQEKLKEALLKTWPDLAPSEKKRGFGPARYYAAPSLQGAIGFIDAVSHMFCNHCNRVRLTSGGFLKLCLCHSDGVDLRALLRSGASEEELRLAMEGAILQKPARHRFGEIPTTENYFMSQIGG